MLCHPTIENNSFKLPSHTKCSSFVTDMPYSTKRKIALSINSNQKKSMRNFPRPNLSSTRKRMHYKSKSLWLKLIRISRVYYIRQFDSSPHQSNTFTEGKNEFLMKCRVQSRSQQYCIPI